MTKMLVLVACLLLVPRLGAAEDAKDGRFHEHRRPAPTAATNPGADTHATPLMVLFAPRITVPAPLLVRPATPPMTLLNCAVDPVATLIASRACGVTLLASGDWVQPPPSATLARARPLAPMLFTKSSSLSLSAREKFATAKMTIALMIWGGRSRR